jgi:hypothetical protein
MVEDLDVSERREAERMRDVDDRIAELTNRLNACREENKKLKKDLSDLQSK